MNSISLRDGAWPFEPPPPKIEIPKEKTRIDETNISH
jgi:hypothetical protein